MFETIQQFFDILFQSHYLISGKSSLLVHPYLKYKYNYLICAFKLLSIVAFKNSYKFIMTMRINV